MKYDRGTWIPENPEEKKILTKSDAIKKMIISPIRKKVIKVPVSEHPTPLAIGYIILKNGMFIEVPRSMYHPLFFAKFIQLYTGSEFPSHITMEQIRYLNSELQLGVYMLDYGMGDGSHSLNKGYVYLPTEELKESFVEALQTFQDTAQSIDFQIDYVKNDELCHDMNDIIERRKK